MKDENVSQLLDTIGELVERLPVEEIERSASTSNEPGLGGAIDLVAYARLIWQWLWLLILCALLAGIAAYFLSITATPIYRATSTWRVDEARAPAVQYSDLILGERTAKTYAQMMTYAPVIEGVASQLNLNSDILANDVTNISVTPVRDTQLLNVSIEGISPSLNVLVANTLPMVFREQFAAEQSMRFAASKESLQAQMDAIEQEVERIQIGIEDLSNPATANEELEMARLQNSLSLYQNQLSTLLGKFEEIRLEESRALSTIVIANPAQPPTGPIRPRVLVNTLMAAIVGGLLALGFVFFVDYLDDRVKTPRQIRRLINIPFLGAVADIGTGRRQSTPHETLIALRAPRNPITEAYRGVRTNIQFAGVDRKIRSLMVTSALPGEGKTTTAANLAVVMAQAGLSVAVVDADLRKPTIHKVFNVPQRPGLVDSLMKEEGHQLSYWPERIMSNLYITPSGQRPPNPAELLGSRRMKHFITNLHEQVDMVILDVPPLLAVADAQILSNLVDGVVCVIRRGTPQQAIVRAVESLSQVNANILGFIMNRMVQGDSDDYYYYYNYYYDDSKEPNTTTVETPAYQHQNGNLNGNGKTNYDLVDHHTSTIKGIKNG